MADHQLGNRCLQVGMATGAVCGAVVGSLLVPAIGTLIGFVVGTIVGFVTGMVEAVVLVALSDAGAPMSALSAAAALAAAGVMAPLAVGVAHLDGWWLTGTLLATGALAALLTPTVAFGEARSDSRTSAGCSGVVTGSAATGGGLGLLVGAVIGLNVDRSTAWFAAVEVGVVGVVAGALIGAVVLPARAAFRRRRGDHEAPRPTATRGQ